MKYSPKLISIKKFKIEDRSLQLYVKKLQQLAFHDPLTDLPNRTLFMDRLDTAMKKAKRSRLKLALLFIDLDKFKNINDAYGHVAGDAVLKYSARVIQSSIRESDTSARLGGDEFTVLLEELKETDIAEKIAANILRKLKKTFNTGEYTLSVSASIGIAEYPQDATDRYLINCADNALNQAKQDGAGTYSWFNPDNH